MKNKDLYNLARFVKKASVFNPEEPPNKPENQPRKKELEAKYKLNLKNLQITGD